MDIRNISYSWRVELTQEGRPQSFTVRAPTMHAAYLRAVTRKCVNASPITNIKIMRESLFGERGTH